MFVTRASAAAAIALLACKVCADEPEGYWRGEAVYAGQAWPVAVRIQMDASRPSAEIDLSAMGVFGHRSGSVATEGGEIRFGSFVRDDRLRFSVRQMGDEWRGTLEAYGITAEFLARRDPSAPPAVRREDFDFENGTTGLAGTLVLPEGPGPHPAIVLTHGSGPQSRNTTLYASFAVFLARSGVAALIYDKRGVGKSTGDWKSASLIDLANDALAGVEALRRRTDIVPGRVGCGGASQGGWVAPLCASLSANVAFVVVNSAPGITPAEQNNYNCETDMIAAGMSKETIDEALALRRRADLYFTTGEPDPDLDDDLKKFRLRFQEAKWSETWIPTPPLEKAGPGTENHYTVEYMLLNPALVWAQIRVPVLAQWGADDRLVPAISSRDIIQSCLNSAGNTRARLVVHSNAGHGLGMTRYSESFTWPRLAPEYLPEVSEWVAIELSK